MARFRWKSPDGSEVFAVNQAHHAAEVLWPAQQGDGEEAPRVAEFLKAERHRLPGGPWLLMNGGDHLAPSDAAARVAGAREAAAAEGVTLRESTMQDFSADARKAAAAHGHLPLHEGELRVPGDRLTFILRGTLSARVDLKQANAAAQTLLERWVEPALALHAPDDDTLAAELRHAWELLLRNAPHDSICGCSVDAVHRENHVRYERIGRLGGHVLQRALPASGLDTRLYGERPAEETSFAVLNPHGDEHTGPVTVELLTSAGRFPAEVTGPDGQPVPFEAEDLGVETSFEADLELLPDSKPSQRHRLRLRAHQVPALGRCLYRVRLSDAPVEAADPHDSRELVLADGSTAAVADDASLTLTRPDGTVLTGFGRLVDGGDSGDTYNYDPPRADSLRTPAVRRTVPPPGAHHSGDRRGAHRAAWPHRRPHRAKRRGGGTAATGEHRLVERRSRAALGRRVRQRQRAGTETVQLYVTDRESTVHHPAQELRAFARVRLEPGHSAPVTLTLGRRAFASRR